MRERKATIYDYARMCSSHNDHCKNCPLDHSVICGAKLRKQTDKANKIILKWCDKHPKKTRQSEFLKMFPNIKLVDGSIKLCPIDVDNKLHCPEHQNCEKCKKEYWLEEI